MDFTSILSNLTDMPKDPFEAWFLASEEALAIAEHDIGNSHSTSYDAKVIDNLITFLNDLSNAISIDVVLNHPSRSLSSSARMEIAKADISKVRNTHTASALASKFGFGTIGATPFIQLSNRSVVELFGLSQKLRVAVLNAELGDDKRRKLIDLVAAFEKQLTEKRVTLASALPILAMIGAGLVATGSLVSDSISSLADGPDALKTIGQISAALGSEKIAADEVLEIVKPSPALAITKVDSDD